MICTLPNRFGKLDVSGICASLEKVILEEKLGRSLAGRGYYFAMAYVSYLISKSLEPFLMKYIVSKHAGFLEQEHGIARSQTKCEQAFKRALSLGLSFCITT